MKIVAVIMVYNCGDVLPETLKSLDGRVDEIFCFDGRWQYVKGNRILGPEPPVYSNDDTREIIEKFGVTSKSKVSYFQLPPDLVEEKARTLTLDYIQDNDWVFVIDSDEIVVEWGDDVRSTLENSQEIGYYIYSNNHFGKYNILAICRFYRKTDKIRYYLNDRVHQKDIGFLCYSYMKRHFKPLHIVMEHRLTHGERKRMPHASEYAHGPHP